MSVNVSKLKSNPRGLNEIFFSGSQSVTKGDEVEWVINDVFAFQATEDCKVSTNASPFVEISAGDIFIIYKRTGSDISSNSSKGLYVFDRDTILRLAYPQETTQDIVIENDNYNNNLNTIIVEADKTPVAKIDLSNSQPYIGEIITVSAASSYAISPSAIASYKWTKNGVNISNASYFTYSNADVRQDDITLVITDTDGRKGNTSAVVNWQRIPSEPPSGGGGGGGVPPPLPNIDFSDTNKGSGRNVTTDSVWMGVGEVISGKSGVGTLRITANTNARPYAKNITVALGLFINGSMVKDGGWVVMTDKNVGKSISTAYEANGFALFSGDVIELKIMRERTSSPRSWDYGLYAGNSGSIGVSLTNRTS